MSRTCPLTEETVLYTECTECDDRAACRTAAEKPVFALLVVGSRTVTDYDFVKEKIDQATAPYRNSHEILIVSGGADGADSLAERYARENGLSMKVMKADWGKYGKRAGYIRNEQMHRFIAGYSRRGCLAFWDGKSRGTQHSFSLAEKFSNPIKVIMCANGTGANIPAPATYVVNSAKEDL